MTTKCNMIQSADISSALVNFDFTDQKGRTVGYKWSISTVTYVALTEAELAELAKQPYPYGYYSAPDEIVGITKFRMHGTPTRDGKGYGPAFNYTDCETLEEANRLVAKRVVQAEKRDAKKFRKEVAA